MNYPDYNTYSKLYGRYLTKSIDLFFENSDPKDKVVLDCCAGGGKLSKYALEHGASRVVMVDTAPQMLNPDFKKDDRVYKFCQNVSDYIRNFRRDYIRNFRRGPYKEDPQFDIVVCRQAINYWFLNIKGEDIARIINPGGVFVFNTFGNKPSETPTVREYYHEGRSYKEISYLVGGIVHHVQTATGFEPHITSFNWISEEEYKQKLGPYFQIEMHIDGPSQMWYCHKK